MLERKQRRATPHLAVGSEKRAVAWTTKAVGILRDETGLMRAHEAHRLQDGTPPPDEKPKGGEGGIPFRNIGERTEGNSFRRRTLRAPGTTTHECPAGCGARSTQRRDEGAAMRDTRHGFAQELAAIACSHAISLTGAAFDTRCGRGGSCRWSVAELSHVRNTSMARTLSARCAAVRNRRRTDGLRDGVYRCPNRCR